MEKLKKEILAVLAEDSRLSYTQIACSLQADEAAVKKCIREMEAVGILVKYTAIINADYLDDDAVEALIEVKVTPQRGHGFDMIAEEVAAHSEVQNLYLMSGAYDLAVIVRGKSLREVSRFVSEKISTYDSVISTATHFILKKYKVESAVMQKPSGGDRLSVHA